MADIPHRIWPLPVRKINGIGPKAADKTRRARHHHHRRTGARRAGLLQKHFGRSTAAWLHEAANGIDERPVVTRSEPKSISRETTFERDLHPRHDRDALSELFTALCARVAQDLQRKGYLGRTIGIKLRFEDFRTVTRDLTLPDPTADPAAIRRAAGECLRRVPLDRKLRLLGVRVTALISSDAPHAADGSPQGGCRWVRQDAAPGPMHARTGPLTRHRLR